MKKKKMMKKKDEEKKEKMMKKKNWFMQKLEKSPVFRFCVFFLFFLIAGGLLALTLAYWFIGFDFGFSTSSFEMNSNNLPLFGNEDIVNEETNEETKKTCCSKGLFFTVVFALLVIGSFAGVIWKQHNEAQELQNQQQNQNLQKEELAKEVLLAKEEFANLQKRLESLKEKEGNNDAEREMLQKELEDKQKQIEVKQKAEERRKEDEKRRKEESTSEVVIMIDPNSNGFYWEHGKEEWPEKQDETNLWISTLLQNVEKKRAAGKKTFNFEKR